MIGYLGLAVLGVEVLGFAVLGIAVLGLAVLGVAVLGTAVLHRTLTRSAQPWFSAFHLSKHPKAWQSQVRVTMSQHDGKP